MRIDHDKVSGALYFKIRDGEHAYTEDFSERADVYLDVDAGGFVLGLEALSFEDLAEAVEEHGGELEVPDRLPGAEDSAGVSGHVEKIAVDVVKGAAAGWEVRRSVGDVARRTSEQAGDVAREASESAGDEETRSPRRSDRRPSR